MKNEAKQEQRAAATRALALLHEQAQKLRAEIAALNLTASRRDSAAAQTTALVEANGALVKKLHAEIAALNLTASRRDSADAQTTALVEANGALVISALHAETVAESAMGELYEVTRVSQLDVLTGTPNRMLMLDRLRSAIALSRRRGTCAALLFVDLDRFKQINDKLGHAVGDEVLRLVAARLKSSVRDSDTVSRHGGDEFLILLPEIAHPSDATAIAAKVLRAVSQPSPPPLPAISASIGIAICPDDGVEPEILIANADTAMYRAKELGGGGFACHGALPADRQSSKVGNDGRALLENEPRHEALREVNEQLLIAALAAQELYEQTQEIQKEQLAFLTKMAREIRKHRADAQSAAKTLDRSVGIPLLLQLQEAIDQQVVRLTDRPSP